jgi:uncharacterized protein
MSSYASRELTGSGAGHRPVASGRLPALRGARCAVASARSQGRGIELHFVTHRDVRVVYTKFDGSLHWHHTMQYLGEDEHGTWLGASAGMASRRGDEPPVIFRARTVQLFPVGLWWTAAFHATPERTEIYCDITSPPEWTEENCVTMVDLDLDVLRVRANQQVLLVDEDEFAAHRVRYGYPPDVIRNAEQAAAWLQAAIGDGAEPFAGGYHRWLDKVR